MNRKISALVEKFMNETRMDDIEVEEFNNEYFVCTDVRQIGKIKKINGEYCIKLTDKYFKGKEFNSAGWC